MDRFQNGSLEKYESEIISEQEKNDIIVEVDKGFSKSFDVNAELSEMSTQKSGLRIPFLISSLTLIITLILFTIFEFNTTSRNEENIKLSPLSTSETEWAILQKFKTDSEMALNEKNDQILIYQGKIIDYDNRLREIRDLITIKNDIETLVDNERNKLIEEGRSSEEINVILRNIESRQIAGLSEELKDEYNTSIADLNNKIAQILEQKTESEERLKESLAERDSIETRTLQLTKAAEGAGSTPALIPVAASNSNNDETDIFYKFFDSKVNEIISALEAENYTAGISEIEKLLAGLRSENGNLNIPDFEKSAYISILKFLKETAIEKESIDNNFEQDEMREILSLSDFLRSNMGRSDTAAEEAELRNLIAEMPEIAGPLEVLTELDKSRWLKSVAATESEDEPEAVLEVLPKAAATPVLQGVITKINFNKIYMSFDTEITFEVGDSFSILKFGNSDESIGTGSITGISANEITGRIISLSNTAIKPEKGDIVRLEM